MTTLFRAALLICAMTIWGNAALAAKVQIAEVKDLQSAARTPERRLLYSNLLRIHEQLGKALEVDSVLLFSTDPQPNAFATIWNDRRLVVINAGLLIKFLDDEDSVAAVLAHELAHHRSDHIASKGAVNGALKVLGTIVGGVLDYKLGRSGVNSGGLTYDAANLATSLVASKFSRDQEREADQWAMKALTQTGYSLDGAVRLHEYLVSQSGSSGSFLSSHPGGEERIAEIRSFQQQSPQALALAGAKQKVALADTSALQAAPAKSSAAPTLAMRPAPLPEPIQLDDESRNLADRAAMFGNKLDFGEKVGSMDEYREIVRRMGTIHNDSPKDKTSFFRYYRAVYLAGSLGRFAKHGQSVGKFMMGEPVPEIDPPPIPKSDYEKITQLISMGCRKPAGECTTWQKDILSPFQTTPYEWRIAEAWWESFGARVPAVAADA